MGFLKGNFLERPRPVRFVRRGGRILLDRVSALEEGYVLPWEVSVLGGWRTEAQCWANLVAERRPAAFLSLRLKKNSSFRGKKGSVRGMAARPDA